MTRENKSRLLQQIEQKLATDHSYPYYDHALFLWGKTMADSTVSKLISPEIQFREAAKVALETIEFQAGFLNGSADSFSIFGYREIKDDKMENFGHFLLAHCDLSPHSEALVTRNHLITHFDQKLADFRSAVKDASRFTLTKTRGLWSAYSIHGSLEADGHSISITSKQHLASFVDPDVYSDVSLINDAIQRVLQ